MKPQRHGGTLGAAAQFSPAQCGGLIEAARCAAWRWLFKLFKKFCLSALDAERAPPRCGECG